MKLLVIPRDAPKPTRMAAPSFGLLLPSFGTWRFLNIRLAASRRVVNGWRARALALALLSAVTLPGPANADVVTVWNEIAEEVAPRFGGPQQQSRVQAIVQIAVHDALNAIEPRYARYTGPARRPRRLARRRGRSRGAPGHAGAAGPAAGLGAEAGRDRHHRGRLCRDRRPGAVRRRHAGGHRRGRGRGQGDPGLARGRRLGHAASALHARPRLASTSPRRTRSFRP